MSALFCGFAEMTQRLVSSLDYHALWMRLHIGIVLCVCGRAGYEANTVHVDEHMTVNYSVVSVFSDSSLGSGWLLLVGSVLVPLFFSTTRDMLSFLVVLPQ